MKIEMNRKERFAWEYFKLYTDAVQEYKWCYYYLDDYTVPHADESYLELLLEDICRIEEKLFEIAGRL